MELLHGGTPRESVSEVLRRRSAASTRPYIADSVCLASLATVMAAATFGRRDAVSDHPAGIRLRDVRRSDGPHLLPGQLTVDELHAERRALAASLATETSVSLHQPAAPLEGLVSRRRLHWSAQGP